MPQIRPWTQEGGLQSAPTPLSGPLRTPSHIPKSPIPFGIPRSDSLPQVAGLAGGSKSYAERLSDYPEIGPLSLADARLALVEPAERAGVVFQQKPIDAIYGQTQGYPYFLQEWGYQVWNLTPKPKIDAAVVARATESSLHRLDEGFSGCASTASPARKRRYTCHGHARRKPAPLGRNRR